MPADRRAGSSAAWLDVMATFSPTSAFVSVDLPALGRPTRQANPDRKGRRSRRAGLRRTRGARHDAAARDGWAACSARARVLGAPHDDVASWFRRPSKRSAVSTSPSTARARAGDRHPAERLGEQAADGVHVLVVELEAEQLAELVDVHARRTR